MEAKIYSVKSACLFINKSKPPQIVVGAEGTVNSTGWTNGRLLPWIYVNPPTDGILDLDFIADKPSGIVIWLWSKIGGSIQMEMPKWLKGVRIHTSNNKLEAMLDDKKCMAKGGKHDIAKSI